MMKAARIHTYGAPDVFKIEDVERPVPGPRDVLVEVHAAAVNPVDYKIRSGTHRGIIRFKLPVVLGMDASGVVVEAGRDVTRFKVGDAVYCSPHHKRQGCYAEYAVFDEREVALKPSNMTHAEAASIPLVGLTAWQGLMAAKVSKGEKILIQAGSGGVGSFAIQAARHLGAEVATTCSARNTELVTSLGAQTVVDYTKEKFEEVLGPQDVVFDMFGGEERKRSRAVMKRGGRLITIDGGMPKWVKKYGPYFGPARAILGMGWFLVTTRIGHGIKTYNVIRKPDGNELGEITRIIEAGAIKAVIDRHFPLDDIAAAHEYIQTGRTRGKIIIDIKGS